MPTQSNANEHSERRRYPRLKAKIPVELFPDGATAPMRMATDEISLCGCYVESMFTMEIGAKMELIFSLNDVRISASGVVATKYPQVGNGIDFVDMAPEDRLKLNAFIEQLEGHAESS